MRRETSSRTNGQAGAAAGLRRGINDAVLLRKLLEGTAVETGDRFFAALVRNLAEVLGTRGAWVTEYLEDARRLRALAFWMDDGWIEEYEYDVKGTPCEPVIENACLAHFPDKVIDLFPNDPDLKPVQAVSYLGAPLLDRDGRILGHLAALDSKPMPADEKLQSVFRIFAARAAAELRRLRAEAEVLEREQRLSGLIDGVMDVIFQVDDRLRVVLANPAAERVFRRARDEMAGAVKSWSR